MPHVTGRRNSRGRPGWSPPEHEGAAVEFPALAGETSPVRTFTPLLGAEVLLDAGASVTLP
ncbi:hypothetical protein AB0A76_35855, partial [Streptomyces exfoliatus]